MICTKKLLAIWCLILLFALAAPALAAEEKIDSFKSTVKINADATIKVSERIAYDFGDNQKHGIFRFIPVSYSARGGKYKLRVSGIGVTDEQNQSYTFSTSYSGDNLEIKIGDADKLITGKKVYIINYTIGRALNYFKDHDELYWNVTGSEWPVDIAEAEAEIYLPVALPADQVQKICFAGSFGSTEACASAEFTYDQNKLVSGVIFKSDYLASGAGLTFAVGWPPGLVYKPGVLVQIWETIKDNYILFLPIVVFIFLFWRWYKYGRDPRGRGVIIAQFDAPDKLTPAEVGTIYDEKVQSKDVSAEIISLAIRGYLKITRTEEGKLFKSADYILDKLKPSDDLADEFDKKILDGLFDSSQQVKLSDLKYKWYKTLAEVTKALYLAMVTKGYFKSNPQKVKGGYLVVGFLLLWSAFYVGPLFGVLGAVSIILCGLLTIIFGIFMPARTIAGVEAKEHILGLKLYMTVAEKDRINFHNAPAKNPQHFEEFLPYAMVLGVEKAWAGQFSNLYDYKPTWYNDPAYNNFNTLVFASSMSHFSSQSAGVMASRPSSASGGGSGFSGGGMGGGFGGGGGGSW